LERIIANVRRSHCISQAAAVQLVRSSLAHRQRSVRLQTRGSKWPATAAADERSHDDLDYHEAYHDDVNHFRAANNHDDNGEGHYAGSDT
jgi:hypothetical protein